MGAKVVRKIIQDKDKPLLGLATGGTPLRLYKELIRINQSGEISFRNYTTFNLDEYGGMSPENKHSYYYYMINIYNNLYLYGAYNLTNEESHVPIIY